MYGHDITCTCRRHAWEVTHNGPLCHWVFTKGHKEYQGLSLGVSWLRQRVYIYAYIYVEMLIGCQEDFPVILCVLETPILDAGFLVAFRVVEVPALKLNFLGCGPSGRGLCRSLGYPGTVRVVEVVVCVDVSRLYWQRGRSLLEDPRWVTMVIFRVTTRPGISRFL